MNVIDLQAARVARNAKGGTKMKSSDYVRFQVTFEDGRVEYFSTPRDDLRSGDYIARIIARERQDKRELSPGKIIAVRRDYQR
jgi:hypothetical protein